MPKRGAALLENSPRKLTRRLKSPEPEPEIEDVKIEPAQGDEGDGGLMNISDDEMEPPKKKGPTVVLGSIKELNHHREKFFMQFCKDVETKGGFDVNGYRKLAEEIPEDDPEELRYLINHHLRDFVVENMLTNRNRWDRFLELSIFLAREQICSASLPIMLISDFMDLSSLQECEEVFEFVENRLNVWKEAFFMNSGRNGVLRMCNDLLRRLSRAQNTIFCGRILLFLSNYFPISERSGLNIMSEFNAENVTSYKKGDGTDDPDDKMEISADEQEEKLFEGIDITIPGLEKFVSITREEKKKKVKVDYNLYVKFWSLQDYFRNPAQCYNKVSWKSFSMYIQDVLGALTSFKIETTPPMRSKAYSGFPSKETEFRSHSSINVVPKLGDADLFFPKYLTNRRLLELQMGDPNFRRYFLVQLLLILQYLTTAVKFKSENQVLSEDQLDFVKKAANKIFSLLRDIKPCGKEFVKSVQHILRREDIWSKWKNDGCQAFAKPMQKSNVESDNSDGRVQEEGIPALEDQSEDSIVTPRRRGLGVIIEEAEKKNRFLLGNPELTRLWNICGDNLDACRANSRDFLPSIEVFFADAFKELDQAESAPPQPLSDSGKRVKQKEYLSNPNFGWRALRLLARNSPYFFQLAPNPPVQPLQNYLVYILKKVAADLELATKEDAEPKIENGAPTVAASTSRTNIADGDNVVEAQAEEDELLKSDVKEERMEEEEEGEVDEKVRNLTEDEMKRIGRLLKNHWKEVALKLHFTKDEIDFFESDKGYDAASYMLKMWTEQENEDATAADLLYQLEGLKLRDLVKEVFP